MIRNITHGIEHPQDSHQSWNNCNKPTNQHLKNTNLLLVTGVLAPHEEEPNNSQMKKLQILHLSRPTLWNVLFPSSKPKTSKVGQYKNQSKKKNVKRELEAKAWIVASLRWSSNHRNLKGHQKWQNKKHKWKKTKKHNPQRQIQRERERRREYKAWLKTEIHRRNKRGEKYILRSTKSNAYKFSPTPISELRSVVLCVFFSLFVSLSSNTVMPSNEINRFFRGLL